MKKRYILLLAALVICVGLWFWLLNAEICIGLIENRTDEQWSQLHVYMNDEITVDFPIEGENQTCLFQYETGRGSFRVKVTDAEGNLLYCDSTSSSGSASFQASSDLKLYIKGNGHGGVFSLLQRETSSNQAENEFLTNGLQVDGTHFGGQFSATYHLRKTDGKYVNFYVRNEGDGPVVITVNGEYDRTIPAGESGHISAPISVSIMPQAMTVDCVTASGDDIDIYWKIAQRNKKSG